MLELVSGRHNYYQRMYASSSVCSQPEGNLIPQPVQSRLIKLHLKVLFKKAILAHPVIAEV